MMQHAASQVSPGTVLIRTYSRRECIGSPPSANQHFSCSILLGQQVCLWQQAGGRAPLGPHPLNERSIEVYLARSLRTHGGAADAAENHVA